jgi:predicted transcriptional regulator
MTLREARQRLDLTQVQLAEAAEVEQPTISQIERGQVRNPAHSTVMQIVRALQKAGLTGITSQDIDEFVIEDETSERTA